MKYILQSWCPQLPLLLLATVQPWLQGNFSHDVGPEQYMSSKQYVIHGWLDFDTGWLFSPPPSQSPNEKMPRSQPKLLFHKSLHLNKRVTDRLVAFFHFGTEQGKGGEDKNFTWMIINLFIVNTLTKSWLLDERKSWVKTYNNCMRW